MKHNNKIKPSKPITELINYNITKTTEAIYMFFSSLITFAPSIREIVTPRGNHYPEFSIKYSFGFLKTQFYNICVFL